jgi:hypothetical protein
MGRKRELLYSCLTCLLLMQVRAEATTPIPIEAAVKPDREWRMYEARTIAQIEGYHPPARPVERSRFGGRVDIRWEASGFFRTQKVNGRWWMVDPDGHPFVSVGINSVRPPRREAQQPVYQQRWGDHDHWAAETTDMLRRLGFNSTGRWSADEHLRAIRDPLPYCTSLVFMGRFGGSLGLTRPRYGHLEYRESIIPVFHPGFADFCDAHAAEHVAPRAQDPYVLGHFTDNELPMPRDLLQRTLRIDPDDPHLGPNAAAARDFLRRRYGDHATPDQVTPQDNLDWLGIVMERYFAITSAAIRRHAPGQLVFGSRIHGAGIAIPQVISAAGRHLDVIALNYYGVWEPQPRHLQLWAEHADVPVLITEFYVKGEDSGLDNTPGAGWVVRTQAERGIWYQNFTLKLLAADNCVGWHYFKYQDEPEDSNKGILDWRFEPHAPMLERVSELNRQAYELRDHLTTRADTPPAP